MFNSLLSFSLRFFFITLFIFFSGCSQSLFPRSSSVKESNALNYPNPFTLSQGTYIGYNLTQPVDQMTLRIYSKSGKLMLTKILKSTEQGTQKGYNKVSLSESDFSHGLSAGPYSYTLSSEDTILRQGWMVVQP